MFLRGHGGESDSLGTKQEFATLDYNGKGYIHIGWGGHLDASGAFKYVGSWGISVPAATWGGWTTNQYMIDVSPSSYGVPVDNEIRPANMAVRYLIRAIS